jgi:tRNA threonylcarbamoyladenosine biosynthesis protein TsaE
MEKISKNIKNTEILAHFFLKNLKKNKGTATFVCLSGDLGVGKTTFTQIFAQKLGIKTKIKSPTFVIMKKYLITTKENKSDFKYFFHMDAYRLKNEKELLYLNWNEIIKNEDHLIFIEWPENIIKAIPKKHYSIQISHLTLNKNTSDQHRKFKIKKV